jgi:hypothetical protein
VYGVCLVPFSQETTACSFRNPDEYSQYLLIIQFSNRHHVPCPAYLLTYSTEHSPSWEANRFSASQEIPSTLWNPNVHYRIHKCPPPVPKSVWTFRNRIHFDSEELLALRPTSQAEGHPFCRLSATTYSYTRSYPPYWRPFLHPQPKDAPCRGDNGPIITALLSTFNI